MIKKCVVLAVAAIVAMAPGLMAAELSSKAKKAEKLLSAGNVTEAMELYKELIDKNTGKKPELVQEGKDGMAKCLLTTGREALKKENFDEAKKQADELLNSYSDTPSFADAQALIVAAQTAIGTKLAAAGKNAECLDQCMSVRSRVSDQTEGVDKLNTLIGGAMVAVGKKAFQDKDYKNAQNLLESAVKNYKDIAAYDEARSLLADVLVSVGTSMLEQKNFDAAQPVLARVAKDFADKQAAVVKAKQGMARILMAKAEEDLTAKKYADALDKCKTATENLAKDDPLLASCKIVALKASTELIKNGEDGMAAGKYDDAIKNFETAATAGIDDTVTARCRYALGVCFRLNKTPDKAMTAYQAVVTEHKSSPFAGQAFHDMYLILLAQDDQKAALDAIKKAGESTPENTDYLFKQARLLEQMGAIDVARIAYEKMLPLLQAQIAKTYVNKEDLQYKLGQAWLSLGKFTEAAVEFDKALLRNPSLIEAKKGLAAAQFADRNFSSAIKTYTELIKQLTAELVGLQEAAMKQKDSVDAARRVEDSRREIALFHYQSGLAYEQAGNFDKAMDECRMGLEGVSTQEAAATLKRIQSAKEKAEKPAEKAAPAAAPAIVPTPAATPAPVAQ